MRTVVGHHYLSQFLGDDYVLFLIGCLFVHSPEGMVCELRAVLFRVYMKNCVVYKQNQFLLNQLYSIPNI